MAVAAVNDYYAGGFAVTSVTISAPTSGNALMVTVCTLTGDAALTAADVTDNASGGSNTYVLDGGPFERPDSGGVNYHFLRCTNPIGSPTLISIPGTFSYSVWLVEEVSGLDQTGSPIDATLVTTSAAGVDDSSPTMNITTTTANAYIRAALACSWTGPTLTPSGGFVSNDPGVGHYDQGLYLVDAGAAGVKTVAGTLDTATLWRLGALAYKAAAGGGGTSLVVQDMAHALAIDNMVLTSQTALTVADSVHALAIDNVALTSSTTLTVADSTHTLAIDNIALTTQTALVIAEMLHGMTMDNIALTSSTALTIAEMNHGVAIDNVTLSTLTGTTLVVADLLHALFIDNMALTSQTALAIADLLHGLSVDGVTLTTASVLAVADMLHAVAMDNMTLVAFNGTTLAIADALHAVAIGNVTLGIANIALVIADVMHGVAIDNMVLTSATALLIADLLHNHTIDNIVLFIPGGGYSTLDLIFKILTNRQELNPTNGTFTLYDDDSTTVLYTAAAWADTAGTVPYSGGKLQRIDALQ